VQHFFAQQVAGYLKKVNFSFKIKVCRKITNILLMIIMRPELSVMPKLGEKTIFQNTMQLMTCPHPLFLSFWEVTA